MMQYVTLDKDITELTQEILCNYDDDTLRLAYADRVEEISQANVRYAACPLCLGDKWRSEYPLNTVRRCSSCGNLGYVADTFLDEYAQFIRDDIAYERIVSADEEYRVAVGLAGVTSPNLERMRKSRRENFAQTMPDYRLARLPGDSESDLLQRQTTLNMHMLRTLDFMKSRRRLIAVEFAPVAMDDVDVVSAVLFRRGLPISIKLAVAVSANNSSLVDLVENGVGKVSERNLRLLMSESGGVAAVLAWSAPTVIELVSTAAASVLVASRRFTGADTLEIAAGVLSEDGIKAMRERLSLALLEFGRAYRYSYLEAYITAMSNLDKGRFVDPDAKGSSPP